MPHVKVAPSTKLYEKIMSSAIHLPNGQSIFACPWHGPATGKTTAFPTNSCEGCIMLYFMRLEAVTPPAEREQLMYNLNMYMTNVVKLAESGGMNDFVIDRHSQVDVQLDPTDVEHFSPSPKE